MAKPCRAALHQRHLCRRRRRPSLGSTGARGISDAGRITGYFTDPTTHSARGFVAFLPTQATFKSLTLSGRDLLDVRGASATLPEGISKFGVVVGGWIDAAGVFHGFLATPK